MPLARRAAWALVVLLAGLRLAAADALRIAAVADPGLRDWDVRIEQMVRDGDLALRRSTEDTLLPGRVHQRFAQLHHGVPVFGGELVRQTDGRRALSVFGTVYTAIDVDTRPTLSAEQARAAIERLAGARQGPASQPDLLVLPRDDGRYALAYRMRAWTGSDLVVIFVDARTGAELLRYSDLETDAAVGLGRGVLGDTKKVSANSQAGTYRANDLLRPPSIRTNDMHGDLSRTLSFLFGEIFLDDSDLAADSDNDWTDGANVDAHTYAGWTYDFYYKRFGRRGLDDRNLPIESLVHPVNRDDIGLYPDEIVGIFYLNAAYLGNGRMLYGEGLPEDMTFRGQHWNYTSGGLDVVAHELTHGVTDYSSHLIYRNESGALNEAFSDMMGTSVEFFFQPAGDGPLHADYLIGEDVITPGGLRSMSNPALYGDPDHYSKRFLGDQDNGGVHINSAIPNQVFYLAIEGGTNRTSGLHVDGVGGDHRDQIEKTFYRGFALLLPASANFSMARAATIRAAQDLYGAGSAPERAVREAWTALGVE